MFDGEIPSFVLSPGVRTRRARAGKMEPPKVEPPKEAGETSSPLPVILNRGTRWLDPSLR